MLVRISVHPSNILQKDHAKVRVVSRLLAIPVHGIVVCQAHARVKIIAIDAIIPL
jgi:hypothetical protein